MEFGICASASLGTCWRNAVPMTAPGQRKGLALAWMLATRDSGPFGSSPVATLVAAMCAGMNCYGREATTGVVRGTLPLCISWPATTGGYRET